MTWNDLRRQARLVVLFLGLVALFLMIVAPPGLFVCGNVKESAKRIACLSNMKGLSTGVGLYVEENDETFPVGRIATGPSALGWAARIAPVMKRMTRPEWTDLLRDPSIPGETMSYAMNANLAELPRASAHTNEERSLLLFEVAGAPQPRRGDSLAALRRSPVGDGAAGGMVDSFDPAVAATVPATGVTSNSRLPASSLPRHGERAIVTYLDGHAGSSAPLTISAGANARETSSPAHPSGCARADLPGIDRPCAASVWAWRGRGTFSLR